MKSAKSLRTACLGLALMIGGGAAGQTASLAENGDKTLSPYFLVKGGDPKTDRMPLKSTRADVKVAGVIADVKVTQVYRNEGKNALEAVYIFPGSTRAAVHAMKMTIGERVVVADIRKRDEARAEYQKALQNGQTASLLEQQRPNVFQMSVGNIQPDDVVKVEMEYTELMVPEDGAYEFVYPTVVGPRYSNRPEEGATHENHWSRNPYLHEGGKPNTTFDLFLNLAGGMPIQDVVCPSHQVNIAWKCKSQAQIDLAADDQKRGTKDFILQYRLQGGKVETGLLLYRGGKENFFLLMAQPPKRLAPLGMPPRDYVFIVDISGSMHGFPLETSKTLLKDLIGGLKPTDTFNVLLFAGDNSILSEKPLAATPENLKKALALIDAQSGGGGTELIPALKRALALPRGENASRTVVIATDGYVTVENEAFDLIRNSLGEANLFAFGIGSSVNRHLIEGMARAGMGEPFVVTQPGEAAAQAAKLRRMIGSPALTRVSVDWGTLKPYDIEPPSIPDVMAERPVIVFGKWRGVPGQVTVKGVTGEGRYVKIIQPSDPSDKLEALRYLWARHRIATLGDFNSLQNDDKRVKQITDLGLEHHLLTAYTSFVAVDKVKRGDGTYQTIQQPLPLPDGVSDLAVGGGQTVGYATQALAASPAACGMFAQESVADKTSTNTFTRLMSAKKEEKRKDSPKISLQLVHIQIKGSLKEEEVTRWFEANLPALGECLKGWNPLAASLEVVLKVTVDGSGNVTGVTVEKVSRFAKSKAECLAQAIKGLTLPAPSDGKGAEVLVAFTAS